MRLPRYLAVMQADTVATASVLDQDLVDDVAALGFDREYVLSSLASRLHNKVQSKQQLTLRAETQKKIRKLRPPCGTEQICPPWAPAPTTLQAWKGPAAALIRPRRLRGARTEALAGRPRCPCALPASLIGGVARWADPVWPSKIPWKAPVWDRKLSWGLEGALAGLDPSHVCFRLAKAVL